MSRFFEKAMAFFRCKRLHQSETGLEYTLYTREKGVICYEFPLFPRPWRSSHDVFLQQCDTFLQHLLRSGVRWYWESARQYDPAPEYAALGLPAMRPVTVLTEANLEEFARDLEELD